MDRPGVENARVTGLQRDAERIGHVGRGSVPAAANAQFFVGIPPAVGSRYYFEAIISLERDSEMHGP
jgi:hypothetical protein